MDLFALSIIWQPFCFDFIIDFKTRFHVEPYLQMQDRIARRTLAKFRCSDHTLEMEFGRHKGVPEKDRIYRRCSVNCIENDEHFLLTCNAYDEPHDKLCSFGNWSLILGTYQYARNLCL